MIQLLTNFAATCQQQSFFSLPTWYKYLKTEVNHVTDKCEVVFNLMTGPANNRRFNGTDVLLVGLGIVDILLRLAALVAVGFVIYGGIRYVTSQGAPDATKAAQNTILNALIGLVLAILAASIVSFIGRRIG